MPASDELFADESEDSDLDLGVESPESDYDVSFSPGPNADPPADVEQYIDPEVWKLYDVYSYRHAAAILKTAFPTELEEIERALLSFRITQKEIGKPGGNESDMPKKFSRVLRSENWLEARIQGDLLVRMQQYDELFLPNGKTKKVKRNGEQGERVIKNFIDGHKIDYVKGRVAFDLEWNSKDQTFDRDLYALRTFHECGLIGVGVLVTRSASLNPIFDKVPLLDKKGNVVLHEDGLLAGQPKSCKAKYGASTTWMGKLLYRLNAGRHGGCPVLVFGITPKLITD